MKLLFDQNIFYGITKKLNKSFPNCQDISDCGSMDVMIVQFGNMQEKTVT
jgi:hypothetical protein